MLTAASSAVFFIFKQNLKGGNEKMKMNEMSNVNTTVKGGEKNAV